MELFLCFIDIHGLLSQKYLSIIDALWWNLIKIMVQVEIGWNESGIALWLRGGTGRSWVLPPL